MAKFRPGIPDTFTLNVDPVRDLGDYLDEPRPAPVARKAREDAPVVPAEPVAAAPEPAVVSQPAAPPAPVPASKRPSDSPVVPAVAAVTPVIPSTSPVEAAMTMTPANAIPPRDEPPREERGGKEKAPRREISMTPETLRMSDELLEVIRSGSGQRDTKANELFHALVLLVHEVRDEIDPHSIPKRGRWGTPTARAYPLELKNAFLRALLERYGQSGEGPAGVTYPVGSAA
jgi:hypothetical protein